jgi:hypothetical protein
MNLKVVSLDLGGSLKRSLGMALSPTIPKAFGFEAATLPVMILKFNDHNVLALHTLILCQ